MLSIGTACALAAVFLANEVRAGGRETGRARDDTQRAFEQTQQAGQRARDDAQQASEGSTSEAPRQRDDDPPRASEPAEGSDARDDGERPTGQRARDARTGKGQDDDGAPKTLLDLIRRMTTPAPAARVGPVGHPAPVPQLASADVLAVGLSS